jgi:hypothetical protein
MPGVGGILFLFRGSSISLCATLKLAWLGFRQCVPPSVEASKPRPMSVRRYSASHSLMFSLRARLVPPVDCHVPTFLLTSTTLAGWPDLQHLTGLEGFAPTTCALRAHRTSLCASSQQSPRQESNLLRATLQAASRPSGLSEAKRRVKDSNLEYVSSTGSCLTNLANPTLLRTC